MTFARKSVNIQYIGCICDIQHGHHDYKEQHSTALWLYTMPQAYDFKLAISQYSVITK